MLSSIGDNLGSIFSMPEAGAFYDYAAELKDELFRQYANKRIQIGYSLQDTLTGIQKLTDATSEILGNNNFDKEAVEKTQDKLTEIQDVVGLLLSKDANQVQWISEHDKTKNRSLNTATIQIKDILKRTLWKNRNVVCVSATVPNSFPYETGLFTTVKRGKNPLAKAYENTAVFIPELTDDDIGELYEYGKFNTQNHARWALPIITSLVAKNNGSTLVLSATVTAGRTYADALRNALKRKGIKVLDQWQGESDKALIDEFKANKDSVLVGTKKLMTGIDASGDTCSMVIIDRVPRSPKNPLDDARAEIFMQGGTNSFFASQTVYAGDAALLLKQAAGRLIRSESDRGVLAILDPRLLKINKWAYDDYTYSVYKGAIDDFPNTMHNLGEVDEYISEGAL
jgi:Rad3-related DNA helicase